MAAALFTPPRLLRHRHLQAILASSALRRRRVVRESVPLARSDALIVECRDGVRLSARHTAPCRVGGVRAESAGRLAILLHGWEGSAESLHVLSAATRLARAGYRVVRVNMRDHGDSHHLNEGIFHSCRLAEMCDAVRWVSGRFPAEAVYLAGFSLGGNFALRIAATDTARHLTRVAAICPVLDPAETLAALDGGSPIYRLYFLRKWRRSLERKAQLFPHLYDFGRLGRFRTLQAMTEFFVSRYTEFPDLSTYLRGYTLTGDRLAGLATPSHVLLADDDPVIPSGALAQVARTPWLQVDRSRWGGHCGFLGDFRLRTWADDYLLAAFGPAA